MSYGRSYAFPSIAGRQAVYTFHTDSMVLWDQAYRTACALGPQMGEYGTLGDGQVQHTPERPVTAGNFIDYCASLADFLVGASVTEQLREDFRWLCSDPYSRDAVVFALGVKHVAGGKTRYFNLQERKVSAREALRHDRRWEVVREGHDGTVTSALGILVGKDSLPWLFESWLRRTQVAKVADELGLWFESNTKFYLKDWARDEYGGVSGAYAARADRAFYALRSICESLRLRDQSYHLLDSFRIERLEAESKAVAS